jgi:acyl-CoA synthetase (AMP-forming)/AMP-acid ligase II
MVPVVDEHETEVLSADTAEQWGRRVASSLRAGGVPSQGFVVIQAQNSAALLAAVYGCLRSELAAVVLSASLTTAERDRMLDGLPYSTILRDEELATLWASPVEMSLPWSDHFGSRPVHFTSGTSGRPKGVWSGWLSAESANALAQEERESWDLSSEDVHLVCGPFSHSAPLRFALQTLLEGGSVLVPKRFDAEVVSSLIEKVATTTFMAPIHLQRLMDTAPPRASSLRLLAHAGSSCAEPLRRRAIECFGVDALVEFYGSTEGQFTRCSASESLAHPGTVGRARANRELRTDSEGRLWCRAPYYARFEYWNDPEKTNDAWDGDWFTVGDLGRVDDDGYVYLEGRRSDLIITGGVNVYPAEIELALSELSGIDELAVFGVEDTEWGQRVCLAYVGPATESEVIKYGADHLAPYKRPKTVVKVLELPHTHSGKIDRVSLPSLLGGDPTIANERQQTTKGPQ